MSKFDFNFYAVVKNEDAPPFVSDGLLVAADGLGGSGSTVHRIDETKHSDLRTEILDAAYGDLKGEVRDRLSSYIDELVLPMADSTPDTSALWGSRIVIARFVYALLGGEGFEDFDPAIDEMREKLVEFILAGQKRVVEHFSLEAGSYSGQSLLPTTLCAIRYSEKDSSVVAECVWAGDSRCYALTPSGLRLLTEDDEDASGSITNLFYVGNKKTTLRYRRYEIEKPCALMTVSDGIFDPVDTEDFWRVEKIFADAIFASDSFDALAGNLKVLYDRIHQDDATVAFKAFGVDGYDAFKNMLAERAKYLDEFASRWASSRLAIEAKESAESDVRDYVATRTSDKYQSAAKLLAPIIACGGEDAAISEELAKVRLEVPKKKPKAADKVELIEKLDTIYGIIEANPADIIKYFGISDALTGGEEADKFNAFVEAANALVAENEAISELDDKLSEREDEYARLRTEIRKKLREIDGEIEEISCLNPSDENAKSWRRLIKAEKLWRQIEYDFVNGKFIGTPKNKNESRRCGISKESLEHANLTDDERRLVRILAGFDKDECDASCEKRERENNFKNLFAEYKAALTDLFEIIRASNDPAVFFDKGFAEKMGISGLVTVDVPTSENPLEEDVLSVLMGKRDFVVCEIVKSLSEKYEATSVIDSLYNATRLSKFRTYYRYKGIPREEIDAVLSEIEKLRYEYNSLLVDDGE